MSLPANDLAKSKCHSEDLPSSVPNGGLVADAESLQWRDVWEGNWRDWPAVTLKNPSDVDLHLTLDHEACPLSVHRREMTVPAGQQVTIDIYSGHPQRTYPVSRMPLVDYALPFSFKIAEFPGSHPGWLIQARVHRAVAVEEIRPDRAYRVTPLRRIAGLSAEIDGSKSGVSVTGPDFDRCYLVQIDPKALRSENGTGAKAGKRRRLDIHADVDGINFTNSHVWVHL